MKDESSSSKYESALMGAKPGLAHAGLTPALLCFLLVLCAKASAAVVINEIFYHPPQDLADLQWIELYNAGKDVVDLGGWSLARGTSYVFPAGIRIEPEGYLVVARKPALFQQHYGARAIGGFDIPLDHGSSHIELRDSAGQVKDAVRYKDHDPWPASPDGYSSSLERICPTASGEFAGNWAPSPLPERAPKPSGTPGARNSCYSTNLPPSISKVKCVPEDPSLGQPIRIEAHVNDPDGVREVVLLYRILSPGSPAGSETALPMVKAEGNRYTATIPAQSADRLVRYRIKAVDQAGTERISPHPEDLRPTRSVWVHQPYKPGKVPFGLILRFSTPAPVSLFQLFRRGASAGEDPPHDKFGPPAMLPPRGTSAFVYVDQETHPL